MRKSILILALASILAPLACPSQLRIDTTYSPTELVSDVLLGNRVKVAKVRYIGSKLAVAAFTDTSGTPLISEGIVLCTGKVFEVAGPNRRANTTYSLGTRGDHSLEGIGRGMTYDAASLEFDFVPEMETVVFNFVFGSEEYTEYVNSQFNDVFAFFISGPGYKGVKNLAVVPQKEAPITVNSVNHIYNRQNYVDNNPYDRLGNLKKDRVPFLYPDLLANYEYDGFTTLLRVEARVYPGQTYHIKIAIADVSDARYDSAVFLEANSFTSLPKDPAQRAQILAEEYAEVRRKFQPVQVGQDPQAKPSPTAVGTDPVPVEVGGGKAVVTNGKQLFIHFDFDEATLDPKAVARLDSAWTHVFSKTKGRVVIYGHTDGQGGEGYNDRLSEQRAAAVVAYLQKKGLPAQRIVQDGFGFHKPVSTNDTDAGRAANRRVEIQWEN